MFDASPIADSSTRPSRQLCRCLCLMFAASLLLIGARVSAQDDTSLFTALVPPNVLIVVDNSGSMTNLVFHPMFDPSATPTCTNWSNTSSYTFSSDVSRNVCGNSRTLYIDPSSTDSTRISGRYLNLFFSDAADPYVTDIKATANGTRATCVQALGLPASYSKYRRQRITAAREVLREVICRVNAVGSIRFGIAEFYDDSDPKGGYVVVPIDDFSATQSSALYSQISTFTADSWTPLGETLYEAYKYFQHRSQTTEGKSAGSFFDPYSSDTSGCSSGGGGCTSSSVPPSPVQYACQKNFVVIITDGDPTKDDFDGMDLAKFQTLIGDFNSDNTSPEAGSELPGDANETGYYLDDIAKFMAETDFRPDMDGDQVIDVYTVGFTTGGAANQLLAKTASVGNGLFRNSSNAEELSQHLVTILGDVVEKSQSFTAATVPASRATDGNNFYASYFLPSNDSAFWEGHIKNFEFNRAGQILDATGACAVSDPTAGQCKSGPLRTTAPAYWDAADVVPAAGSRKLYASRYSTPPSSLALPPAFDSATMTATDLVSGSDVLGSAPYAPSDFPTNGAGTGNDLRDRIVDYVRGCEWDSSPCVARGRSLWDIFHSNPLLVGAPNAPHEEPSYRAFASKYRHRDRMLYAGSNGGFMHAFHAGSWDTSVSPNAFDRGTGVEQFGFMSYPARQKIKELAKDDGSSKNYYMDGSSQAADVWLYPTATSVPSDVDEWHTVLLGNMRQGGNVVWALDVTDPPDTANPSGRNSSLPFPAYLWEFPCEASSSACTGSGTHAFSEYMGESWSDPVVTRIKVRIGSNDNNGRGFDRWVAIFGGGYDPSGDPNDALNYDATSGTGTSRSGRAIFIVDLKTGKPIAMKRFDHSSLNGDPRMKYAFTSSPAVFDADYDDYADVIYIGDLGGNLWKWVIKDIAVMPTSDADLDQPAWNWVRLFEADHCSFDALNPTLCPEEHYRSFFFPPTGSLLHGTLWLAFGTGERNKLDFPGYAGTTRENNRSYVMRDGDPWEKLSTATPSSARFDDIGSSTDFVDAGNASSCSYPDGPEVGFYIQASDGEKFITNSVIFFGTVYTLSFKPLIGNDPCAAGGTSFLYGFDLFCSEGVFTRNTPGGGVPERIIDVGPGIPNRPRVSVGPVNTNIDPNCTGHDCDPSCKNMVVVITSDGNAYTDSPDTSCPSGIRLNSWRDF